MKKECCNIKVTEIDNGYQVEVTGDELKENCKAILENCGKNNNSCGEILKKFCC